MALTNEELYREALRIVEHAERHQHQFRIIGSIACYAHSPSAAVVLERAGRRVADIDLVTTSSVRQDTADGLLAEFGYEPYTHHNVWHAETRQMYDRDDGVHVDLFRDELNFCHPIPLRSRLEDDAPTIPLAELVLQKLQIVEINEKDLQDVGVLLLDHALGHDRDELDGDLIAQRLAGDWGFWYTATTNLGKLRAYIAHEAELFGPPAVPVIDARAAELEAAIEQHPKSARWKMRAKLGTRMRWYQEVEEAHR
jgi:hypothetical protein